MTRFPFAQALAAALVLFLAASPVLAPPALAASDSEGSKTESQDMSVGEASENMMDDAKNVGEKAKQIAGEVAEKAGGLAEDAVEGAKALYEKAKAKVEEITTD